MLPDIATVLSSVLVLTLFHSDVDLYHMALVSYPNDL